MWKKVLITIFFFCFLALLQDSFFTHFILFGSVPNLVFALFFTLVFFSNKVGNYEIVSFAIIGGFFLDIFSYTYIGPSIISLVIIGLLLKKAQSALTARDESYPFSYFLPLFVVFLLLNELIMGLYSHFIDANKLVVGFDETIISYTIYSSIFAVIFFFIYKKNLKHLQQW